MSDQRLRMRRAASALALLVLSLGPAVGQTGEPSLCEYGPQSRASVNKVERQAGAKDWLRVERGNETMHAKSGCFLQPGDILRPDAGISAEIRMPDKTTRSVKFPDVLEIPAVAVTSSFQSLLDFTLGILGSDWQDARDMATAVVGDTRETIPSRYLIMPGVFDVGEQSIDTSHPLWLRWVGSIAPFSISIRGRDGADRTTHVLQITSERHAKLDLSGMAVGVSALEVKGANGVALALPLRLVAPGEVPPPQGATTNDASSQEYRSEAAIFLLRRAPSTWRLEAISRLLALASEDDDFFAQAIVGLENITRR
ncbi:hypothetical protein [Mesorhizobium loti]|uniref:hypothetical protein n=1 Tax=Rhizobium loti TaxID=381 RepID=UPI000428B105|nr:hypothetical protein [Mesorhizobium loti]